MTNCTVTLDPDTKQCTMIWESPVGGPILSDQPLVVELRRADGSVIMLTLISPSVTGGRLYGIGVR